MVQNYLEILNLHDRELDFKFLSDIVTRHISTFAFSSVGCQLGDDLLLDFKSLYQRIVIKRRGGYCFEQNGLLYGVLEEVGFSPKIFLARVMHKNGIDTGLTHQISMVEYEGRQYVLDVAFGFQGPTFPVPMPDVNYNDSQHNYRIIECRSSEYHLQVLQDGDFSSLYQFELARYNQADCEIGHFFSHRHPDAKFVNHLVVSLIHEHETRALVNLKYQVIKHTNTESWEISDSDQLKRIIVDELGVQITEDESWQLYERLVGAIPRL